MIETRLDNLIYAQVGEREVALLVVLRRVVLDVGRQSIRRRVRRDDTPALAFEVEHVHRALVRGTRQILRLRAEDDRVDQRPVDAPPKLAELRAGVRIEDPDECPFVRGRR